MMKLYAWQPNGHGELSWFVIAETEKEARESVDREITRRLALPFDDLNHITDYEIGGWGTDYYTLTVAWRGQVLDNANE